MVEYFRLWDDGTWDTDFIEIPQDTPPTMLNQAVIEAANSINWNDELPVMVGFYSCDEE